MLGQFISSYGYADEIETASGQAIVRERYAALRRQIPVVYLLALVNLCGLEVATRGKLALGLNFPTVLAACAMVRIALWLRTREDPELPTMIRRMRQTCALAAVLCLAVGIWCNYLFRTEDPSNHMAVILFGGLTAIGVAYGLSCHPAAARIPLLVLAFPVAGTAIWSDDPMFVGAALSLAAVALLILRLLSVHNSHFTDVIRSRSMIAWQQEQAEQARKQALVAAATDFLTGLPNRRAFVAALDAETAKAGDSGTFGVAVVDLDRFKAVNDTFGHASGDQLLETVAARLADAVGDSGLVARLGGDEFGLLVRDVASAEEVRAAGVRILAEVNRAAAINGRQFAVSACCGFVLSAPGCSRTPSQLLAEADLALYQAKGEATGGVAVFEPGMEASHRRRMDIERALRSPGVDQRIHLVFQPILDLRSGRVSGHEALARWNDPQLGDVAPSEFVPIAEQINIIGHISDALMMKAFTEAAQWPPALRLSFNLSAVQLCSPASADKVLAALREAGLSTKRLQVEVTETALLADFAQARENLARLRSSGVTIVLDDFGAGYASIGYLREMRFDQIKLDGALVTAAQESADGERLLAAVIGLCQALGVTTVAEHVENQQQLELLVKLGCDAAQGYWLHAPMSAEAAGAFADTSQFVACTTSVRSRRRAA